MKVTLCDVRIGSGAKTEPCGERASVEVRLRWDNKDWILDACDKHSKELTVNAREAEAPLRPAVTRLPDVRPGTRKEATPLVTSKVEYAEMRKWLEANGKLPEGSRGRISKELQSLWLSEDSPVVVD